MIANDSPSAELKLSVPVTDVVSLVMDRFLLSCPFVDYLSFTTRGG